jgi:hypothetical protein
MNQTPLQKNQSLSAELQENLTKLQLNQILAQLASFGNVLGLVMGTAVFAIALMVVVPLLLSMYLRYRQEIKMNSRPAAINQLYRVLVAIGVIFVVVLIVVTLTLIWFNSSLPGQSPTLNALLETQKNFLTIIGTAFASLVAFYFGTRGTQRSNAERTTAITGQKALEVINVNPIDRPVGVEVDSPVTATFSAPVRSSTINTNTFSVKDANGNPVQGKITLIDNNTTIRFNPVPPFNRNSRYTVTITKGIIDLSGASLAADIEWHFTAVA